MAEQHLGECRVCHQVYDHQGREPRCLPCGHSLCTPCLADMLKKRRVVCPSCHTHHKPNGITAFPKSHSNEEKINAITNQKATSLSPEFIGEGFMEGLSDEVRYLVQEQKNNIKSLGALYQDVMEQLCSYEAQLLHWQNTHKQLTSKLNNLLMQNTEASKLLGKEQNNLQDLKKELEERRKQEHQQLKERLFAIVSTEDALTAIENIESYKSDAKSYVQKFQERFPDVNVVFNFIKVQEATKKGLEVVTTETGAADASLQLEDITLNITEKVNRCEELRPVSGPMKTLLEAGWVMAFQQDHDRPRFSRMTVEDGQLHVYALQGQATPAQAVILQHSTVVGLVDPSSTLVFLDLSWGGLARGRVYIRLDPDNGLAKQFLMLCTGERGSSYIGTRMIEIFNKGKPGERVCGGDNNSTGDGGTRLVPGVQVGPEYRRTPSAGTVRAEYGPGSNKSAQFCIFTREADWKISFAFGQVEHGLKVVKAAVKHTNIKEVTVADCGMVLPL